MILKKLAYLSFVAYPILAQYYLFTGMAVGEFILIILLLLMFLSYNKVILIQKSLWIFGSFIIAHGTVILLIKPDYLTDADLIWKFNLRLTMAIFIITISSSIFDAKILYKYLRLIGILVCVVLYLQFFSYYLTGKIFWTGEIPFLNYESSSYGSSMRLIEMRFNSIFSEPASFSSFMLPITFYSILFKKYGYAIFFTIAIVISTSSLGIISVLIIWGYFLVISGYSVKHKGKIFLSLLVITLVLFSIGIFQKSLDFAINKISTINLYENPRLLKGFYTYSILSWPAKTFGVGFSNAYNYLQFHGIGIKYGYYGGILLEYMNMVAKVLVYFGIIGCILCLMFMIDLLKNVNRVIKILVVIFIISLFVSQIFFNPIFNFTLSIILIHYNKAKMASIKF